MEEKYLKELRELYNTGKIESGEQLNKFLRKKEDEEVINFQVPPKYNILNLDKPTVFCHLNPGGNPSPEKFRKKLKEFSNSDEFIANYKETRLNYPKSRFLDRKEFDNFDYKQALFLSGFPNNGIELCSITNSDISNNKEERSKDCYAVLSHKTQLELLPFESKKFKSLFDSVRSSKAVFPHIKNYFIDLLDIITSTERRYVLFGSNQYDNLIKIASNELSDFEILRKSKKIGLDIGTKNKAYVTILDLKWKDEQFSGLIAHSFPRQDLPNAFEKMKKYGELCYQELEKFSKNLK